ncbi:MAG: hypothetical protein FJ213_01550 [Ignavibacteria bacterium]|nr:hypothetical protein [Ignavibacteria bacterium]
MKKIFFFLSCASFIFLFSCSKISEEIVNPSENAKGGVTFTLLKSAIPPEVKVVSIKLERSGYPIVKDSVVLSTATDTVRMQVNNLIIGYWNLTVTAQDEFGIVKYTGFAYVQVLEGITTSVYIAMSPVGSGTGNLEIFIYWGLAKSKWTMYLNNPVLNQSPGGWDAEHFYVVDPTIVKVGSQYKMWYTSGNNSRQSIAYATSSNGINWTKHGIVIEKGPIESWFNNGVSDPTVIYEDGIYKMWFVGKHYENIHNGIGYATSIDGVNWTLPASPVISPSGTKPHLFGPCILKKEGIYFLYYTVGYSIYNREIFLMKSVNGTSWEDYGMVLKRREGLKWEEDGVFVPMVFYDEGKFKMYYSSMSDTRNSRITLYCGYTESNDGLTWINRPLYPELEAPHTKPWLTMSATYPYIIREGSKLRMWFSGLSTIPNQWQIGYAEQ